MNGDIFTDIINKALQTTLMISAPMLIGALVMGILVSIFQAVTQINEQTLSFIPKIIVIVGALVICGPWMSQVLVDFSKDIIINIPNIISQN